MACEAESAARAGCDGKVVGFGKLFVVTFLFCVIDLGHIVNIDFSEMSIELMPVWLILTVKSNGGFWGFVDVGTGGAGGNVLG